MTMTTVVSLTPLSVEADSRTYRQAASIARMGYRSVVVEGQPSTLDETVLPFELRTVPEDRRLYAECPPQSDATSIRSQGRGEPTPATRRLARMAQALATQLPKVIRRRLSLVLGVGLWLHHYVTVFGRGPFDVAPRADLYWVHGFQQYLAVAALCRWYRVGYVYDAHDFYPEVLQIAPVRSAHERALLLMNQIVQQRCMRRASEVVTVSDGVADLFQARSGRRPVVARNCHDGRLDEPTDTNIRQTLELSPRTFLVVMVGNAKPGMACAEALDAMLELPDHVHLALVGRGYEGWAQARAQRSLDDRVHLVGPVAPTKVVPFIAPADAAAVLYYGLGANYLNSLPNGFFQAIAAGLPLVYPELPAMRRIAAQYEIGIPMAPLSARSIAAAIRSLVEDRDRAAKLKQNAESARTLLTWEREEAVVREIVACELSGRGA